MQGYFCTSTAPKGFFLLLMMMVTNLFVPMVSGFAMMRQTVSSSPAKALAKQAARANRNLYRRDRSDRSRHDANAKDNHHPSHRRWNGVVVAAAEDDGGGGCSSCSWKRVVPDRQRRLVCSHLLLVALVSVSAGLSARAATLESSSSSSSSVLPIPPAAAASRELPSGLLESRVTENVLSPPPYGMEEADILYPRWFAGTWTVASTSREVLAPCGVALFGGNATYQAALQDVGTTLYYESRFLPTTSLDGKNDNDASATTTALSVGVIADREYNVKSIAKAALGPNSVVDVKLASPNQFSCVLAPRGSPSLLNVDMITLNRRQERVSDNQFDCSEVVREIVAPVAGDGGGDGGTRTTAPMPILKEIETTSLYTYDPASDTIACQQRSASFLLPSQTNPMAMKLWEYSQGRPVDVRFYTVRYTRRTT